MLIKNIAIDIRSRGATMYIPKAFHVDDTAALHKLMREYSFATLVTQQDGIPLASHLPFLLDAERGTYGTLLGHMARGNSQWRTFKEDQESLVIFQGPHAYISPSWYEAELAVPTWNYAVVHAYGVPRLIEDKTVLYSLLQALVKTYEAGFEKPWAFESLPDEYVQKMMQGIVGFEIPIRRLEGKFKLNQNRPVSDQARVATVLSEHQDDLSEGVAALMKSSK